MCINELQRAAYNADLAYQSELVRVYGKDADGMRHRPSEFNDAALIAARELKLAASKAWERSNATRRQIKMKSQE